MTTRSTVMTFASLGLAAALGLSACGGSGSGGAIERTAAQSAGTPKEKVAAVLSDFWNSSSAALTFSIDGTAQDVDKIDRALESTDRLTRKEKAEMDRWLTTEVTMAVSVPEGQTLGEAWNRYSAADPATMLKDAASYESFMKSLGAQTMAVSMEGSALFESATQDGVVYLRLDLDKIAALADQELGPVEGMLGDLPPVLATPAQKLFDGEWVSIDTVQAVRKLEEQGALSQLSTAEQAEEYDPTAMMELLTSLRASYDADAEVSEVEGGYRVSVPLDKTAKAVQDEVMAVVGETSVKEYRDTIKDLDGQDLLVDLRVEDGELTGLNVDLTQFVKGARAEGARLALDLAVDAEAGPVSMPGGVTALDVPGLFNLIPANALTDLASAGTAGS